jgi:hypothetical protein
VIHLPWKLVDKGDVFILELFEGTNYHKTSPILPNIDDVLLWLDKQSDNFISLGKVDPYGISGNLIPDRINLSEECEIIRVAIRNGKRER